MTTKPLITPLTISDHLVPDLLQQRANLVQCTTRTQQQQQPPRHLHRDSATFLDSTSSSSLPPSSDIHHASYDHHHALPLLPVPIGPQLNWLDPSISHLVKDPRDTVFIKTSLYLSMGVVSALYLILVQFSWWHFVVHVIWVASYATTFVLMLHCVCHRPLFKPQFSFLSVWIPYLLGPFYGHTWETFYWHHIKHHHVEDNGPMDLSCTLWYQRDSVCHFLWYFTRFFLFTMIELPMYFYRKGWMTTAIRIVLMEFATWSLFAFIPYIGHTYTSYTPDQTYLAAILTLVVPVPLMRFGMMSGNWAQHAFVDRTRPDCDYVQSLTCIDTRYNQVAFNDGYHTSHHLNPRRHWADHPGNLITHADDYARQGTIVFQGIDFHVTWWYLMTKNYKGLAKAYVHLDPLTPRPSDHDIITMLKDRVKQMSPDEVDAYYAKQAKIQQGQE